MTSPIIIVLIIFFQPEHTLRELVEDGGIGRPPAWWRSAPDP
jgi:hypothetical protein